MYEYVAGQCVCPEEEINSSVLDMFISRCLFGIQVELLSRWLQEVRRDRHNAWYVFCFCNPWSIGVLDAVWDFSRAYCLF